MSLPFEAFFETGLGNACINFICAGVGAALSFGAKKLYNHHCSERITALLGFSPDVVSNVIAIKCFTANPGKVDENEKDAELVYPFEYLAAGSLDQGLRHLYPNSQMVTRCVHPNDVNDPALGNGDMILIGGPNHNALAKKYLFDKNLVLPFYFSGNNLYFRNSPTSKEIPYLPVEKNGIVTKDYCVIINVFNPQNPKHRIVGIFGCCSIGCLGGAVFLSELMSSRKTSRSYAKMINFKAKEYGMIISCEGNDVSINDNSVTLLRFFPIDTKVH